MTIIFIGLYDHFQISGGGNFSLAMNTGQQQMQAAPRRGVIGKPIIKE